jgi:hypothetical protein
MRRLFQRKANSSEMDRKILVDGRGVRRLNCGMVVTTACEKCGAKIEFSEAQYGEWAKCPKCGDESPLPMQHDVKAKTALAHQKPHRAGAVLALAIVGWIFFPAAICALVMGNADVREMEAGKMDASGKATTDTATSVALIGLLVWLVGFVALFVLR